MVTVERLRPDLPSDLDAVPGGSFAGMPEYLALMQGCWDQDPEARPDFESIIGRLRRLLAVEALTARGGSGLPTCRNIIKLLSSDESEANASLPHVDVKLQCDT